MLGLLASWVIVPASGSGTGSPQSSDAVKSLAGKPAVEVPLGGAADDRRQRAVKVPTMALTFWKPSTVLIVTARAGGDHQRADVGDVDLAVVDRVDDARAGDGDEHFAGKQTAA